MSNKISNSVKRNTSLENINRYFSALFIDNLKFFNKKINRRQYIIEKPIIKRKVSVINMRLIIKRR